MKPSTPIYRLKQRARHLARTHDVPLHAALDRVAEEEGFSSWSLLAFNRSKTPRDNASASEIFRDLVAGDLLLLGARPGHGKTLMGLKLAVEAMKAGHSSTFFSLEYTAGDMGDRFRAIGVEPESFGGLFAFDDCDDICAGHIAARLAAAPAGTLAVIDYLQLLDQRRDKPALDMQIAALRDLARQRGVILVFISQIDRSYDPAAKPLPGIEDVRQPNRFDLAAFTKACFLHGGKMAFQPLS